MYRILGLLLLWGGFLLPSQAQQQKADFEQVKKFGAIVHDFRNDLSVLPYFINDTDKFWYRLRTGEGIKYYLVDPEKKFQTELFDMKDMLRQLAVITHKAYTSGSLGFVNLDFAKDGKSFAFSFEGDDYEYDLITRKLSEKILQEKKRRSFPSGHLLSPDSCYLIYAKDHNLYCYGNRNKGMDTTVIQLTTDGELHNSYAKYPEAASGTEDLPKGRWLKNSRVFLAEIDDSRALENMYVLDMLHEPRPELVSYRYSCPGDTIISKYGFKLVDVNTRKIQEVWGEKWKNQYVEYVYDNTNAGSEFFFFRTKRTWEEKELCAYDLNTGKLRVVLNEVDKPFFDFLIAQTHFINDGREFLFRSERTGLGHFYLYDGASGQLKRAVTAGDFLVGQLIKMDTLCREIYFYAYGREKEVDPYYYMAYRAHLDKPGMQLLTPENANHKVYISPSSKYIIDTYSRVDMPAKAVVRNRSGKVVVKLEEPDVKGLFESGWRAPERFCVKAADGVTDLYGVMWKPMDFDSTRTYPVISEVYPGPHFEYVPTSFCLEYGKATRLAQLGFIVIQVGHRGGTPLRGKAYHRYGYGKLRDYPLADDKAVITALARKYSFIDVNKVGIFGHSGGGFMAAAALCTYPEFYSAAVSLAGNHDNRIYNTGWIEMNNGVREVVRKNPVDPADSIRFQPLTIQTNLELAKRCRGHLLLVTGMMDKNVHPAHAFRMADALMKAGKNFDMLILPKSSHGLVGAEEEFYLFKMRNHFAKYLLDDFSGERFTDFK